MANLIVRYFVQLRYDGDSNGYVSQRYPKYDYEDVPFPNLDLFCQPNGWKLTKKRKDPTFFIFVLTSEHGGRLYCPCLSFSEPLQSEQDRRSIDAIVIRLQWLLMTMLLQNDK